MINKLTKLFIRLYQKLYLLRQATIASLLPLQSEATCRFTPTCSQYALEAIEKFGSVKGILLSTRRVARCHPWSKAGLDPVPK